jgi:PKD repeat protein
MFRISLQLIEKILLTIVVLLGFHWGSKAQCHAGYTFTVDSINGFVQCTNTSSNGTPDSPAVYTWYESPGNVLSNSVNPKISLPSGQHSICLKIVNDTCSDSICHTITMPVRFCAAKYTYSIDNNTGTTEFTNMSSGSDMNFIWSFGDGVSFSTDSNPTHTFNTGWYYVCLNIKNGDSSCGDFICQYIRVQKPTPGPCIADFDYSYDSLNSRIVHFSNTTFSDSSTNVIWLFPNDERDTAQQPAFDFEQVGNYTVCMLVSGPLCADSICKTIEVIDILPACKADFTYRLFADTVMGGSPRIAVFTNLSTGTHVSYKWLVNDSLVSEEQAPLYYYPEDGLYTVCLIAYTQNSCFDSICKSISIISNPSGVDEQLHSCSISILPNPAYNEVSVEAGTFGGSVQTICVYDLLGNMIIIQETEKYGMTIPLTNLAKGIYIIEVKTSNNLIRKKMSKL